MERNDLFEIFKLAVDKEHEAYETYKGIAEKVDDENLKKIFEDIANDELRHKEQIMEQYNILKK
jgi:rubrerythrin